ncbi:hypothetical protein HMPREF1546_04332 [Oscillibacter sp. KLE 1745]|nr:hypothetical protein HMPREF1546_04332 [Oscillibacter sp. KLE 1745]
MLTTALIHFIGQNGLKRDTVCILLWNGITINHSKGGCKPYFFTFLFLNSILPYFI